MEKKEILNGNNHVLFYPSSLRNAGENGNNVYTG